MEKLLTNMAIIASDYRATSSVVSSSTATKAVIYGDVNLDGSITQEDATVIQEYIGKVIPSLTDEQQIAVMSMVTERLQ